MGKIKEIAIVLLENEEGHIALQLRDNFPHIANPDKWGIFGGSVEAGEDPKTAALREIEEELTIHLDPLKLNFLQTFLEEPQKKLHLFHYPITNELDNAQLREGQRFQTISKDVIQTGVIDGKQVANIHRVMLNRYWEQKDSVEHDFQ